MNRRLLLRTKTSSMLVGSILLYVLCYWMLMVRNLEALDRKGVPQFKSSCRFTPYPIAQRDKGGLSTYVGRVTLLNYLFLPADVAYFRLLKSEPWRPHDQQDFAVSGSP